MDRNKLTNKIFNLKDNKDFEAITLEIFLYQYKKNQIFKKYLDNLEIVASNINKIVDIPFIPISLFKTHRIATQETEATIFKSSGTTGQKRSCHYVFDINIYEKSLFNGFSEFFGDIKDYVILALLPSYLENCDSSLVYMVDKLINKSNKEYSKFYLYNHHELKNALKELKHKEIKTILIGVSYAILDFAEQYPIDFPELIVMETGGMKGEREELSKENLHKILTERFNVKNIYSEYGMTELLSQAYSTGNGIFKSTSTMQILIRNIYNPFQYEMNGKIGAINVVDLSNIDSCSFIATDDLGIKLNSNSFRIEGRISDSVIRGCNLLIK